MSVKIWSSSLRTDFFKCELWRLVDVWGMRIRLSLLFVFYRFSLLRCYLLVFQWRQRTLSILMKQVTCDCNVLRIKKSKTICFKLLKLPNISGKIQNRLHMLNFIDWFDHRWVIYHLWLYILAIQHVETSLHTWWLWEKNLMILIHNKKFKVEDRFLSSRS